MNSEDVRQSLKERQRQERERLILLAAEEMLLERGYYEISMEEIAAQVGIAKSTVYLHFPGKEELVIALVEQKMNLFLALIVETMKREISAREKLEILFQHMYVKRMALTMGQPDASISLLIKLYNSTDLHPLFGKVGGRVQKLLLEIRDRLLALLEEGQAVGEFDDLLPAEVMLGCFFSMISPLIYGWLKVERTVSGDDLVEYTKCMYFRAITASMRPQVERPGAVEINGLAEKK